MTVVPSCLSPDREEIASRIERVRSQVRELCLTHHVCHSPDNILYLTNAVQK